VLLLGLSAAGATEEKDHVSLRFDAGAAVWVCRVRSWLSWLSGALWAESMLYEGGNSKIMYEKRSKTDCRRRRAW